MYIQCKICGRRHKDRRICKPLERELVKVTTVSSEDAWNHIHPFVDFTVLQLTTGNLPVYSNDEPSFKYMELLLRLRNFVNTHLNNYEKTLYRHYFVNGRSLSFISSRVFHNEVSVSSLSRHIKKIKQFLIDNLKSEAP